MGGTKPAKFFRCKKKNNNSKFPKKSGLRPGNKGGLKIEKKVVFFGIKNVKNFKSEIQFFFLKNFSTHQCGRKGTLH